MAPVLLGGLGRFFGGVLVQMIEKCLQEVGLSSIIVPILSLTPCLFDVLLGLAKRNCIGSRKHHVPLGLGLG